MELDSYLQIALTVHAVVVPITLKPDNIPWSVVENYRVAVCSQISYPATYGHLVSKRAHVRRHELDVPIIGESQSFALVGYISLCKVGQKQHTEESDDTHDTDNNCVN